jgi:hypothetical protein
MQTCGVVASVEKFVLLLCFLLQLFGEKRNVATAQTGEPEPYLLFTTQNSIQRLYLNGSTPPQILLGPTPGLIRKIDYHYRMNYMFWLDGSRARGRLMRARLNGSDVTTLLDRLTDPGTFQFQFLILMNGDKIMRSLHMQIPCVTLNVGMF